MDLSYSQIGSKEEKEEVEESIDVSNLRKLGDLEVEFRKGLFKNKDTEDEILQKKQKVLNTLQTIKLTSIEPTKTSRGILRHTIELEQELTRQLEE